MKELPPQNTAAADPLNIARDLILRPSGLDDGRLVGGLNRHAGVLFLPHCAGGQTSALHAPTNVATACSAFRRRVGIYSHFLTIYQVISNEDG